MTLLEQFDALQSAGSNFRKAAAALAAAAPALTTRPARDPGVDPLLDLALYLVDGRGRPEEVAGRLLQDLLADPLLSQAGAAADEQWLAAVDWQLRRAGAAAELLPPSLGGSARRRPVLLTKNALLWDTFSDADDTGLGGKALQSGGSWAAHEGAYKVYAGWVGPVTYDDNRALATAEANAADVLVRGTIRLGAGADGGLVLRYSSPGDYWIAYLDDFSNQFQLYERNNNAVILRASVSVPLSPGTDYVVQAALAGAVVTATLNGACTLSYPAAGHNQTAGRFGVLAQSHNGTGTRFNDFLVVAL